MQDWAIALSRSSAAAFALAAGLFFAGYQTRLAVEERVEESDAWVASGTAGGEKNMVSFPSVAVLSAEEPSVENFDRMNPWQQRWFLHEMVSSPSFSLGGGADWRALEKLLARDLGGTLRALARIDVKQSAARLEIPLCVASYLSGKSIEESEDALRRIRENTYLHEAVMSELVVAIDDQGTREAELLDFFNQHAESPEAVHAAEMMGARLGERNTIDGLIDYTLQLPSGETRGNLLAGVLQSLEADPETLDEAMLRLDNTNGEFDEAIKLHSLRMGRVDLDRAFVWTDQIQNAKPKKDALADIFRQFGEEVGIQAMGRWMDENADLMQDSVYLSAMKTARFELGWDDE